jgi:hypothetical protein
MLCRDTFIGEARARCQTSLREICDGKRGTGTVFIPVLLFSPVTINPPILRNHLHLHLHAAVIRRTNGGNLGTLA